jgi:large subunit ribosomal protein L7/L12
MSNNIETLVEKLSALTIIEAAELSKALEEKWGVTAAVGMAAQAAQAAVEEKTEFDVYLVDAGAEKLKVVKDVKEISGLGLKESKDLVDSSSASSPKLVKSGVSKDESNALKAKLEASGAKVELK